MTPARDHLPPACPCHGPRRADQRDRGLPDLRDLRTTFYRWAGRARVRAGRADAQGPPSAGDAEPDPARAGRERSSPKRWPAPPWAPAAAPRHLAERGVRLSAVGRAEDPGPPRPGPSRPARGGPGPADRGDHRPGRPRRPRRAPSGSATSRPGPGIWSPWTASTSASSKGSARSGSSPRSTPPPAGRSVSCSSATRPPGRRRLRRPRRRAPGRVGVELTGVLTDNGPEFTGKLHRPPRDLGVRHHRIPPRSPNHNAVCERFQGTALQEFYRPAFHRQHFDRLGRAQRPVPGLAAHYNTRRRNHGDFMRGRTPFGHAQLP